MYPELFRISDFPINTYGVLLALALMSGIFVWARIGSRDGLPSERLYDLGLWIILGSIIGSKILLLWTEPVYRQNPLNLISLDFLRSGGVFYGGLIGALITAYIGVRYYKLPWWPTADAGAVGIALGQTVGRLGCFAAGCCWGKPTHGWWGIHFTPEGNRVTGVPIEDMTGAPLYLHPTQLYEAAGTLILFFVLLWLHKRKSFYGQVFLTYAISYSVLRFIIEFFRDDPRGDIAGLTTLTGLSSSQMISILFCAVALVLVFIRRRRAGADKPEPITPVPARAQ